MNLLVVGGAGYIGSVAALALLQAGHKVVVLDDLSKGHRAAVPAGAVFQKGDLGDAKLVADLCRAHKFDSALHFAAHIEVEESSQHPDRYFDNNFVKTKRLLDTLIASSVKQFVFSSTAAVYGEPVKISIPEDHPRAPTSPYGWTKLFVEELLWAYSRAFDLRAVALRYFNAAGAVGELGEDHRPESHLIPHILEVALGLAPSIKINGGDWPTPDGTCIRDFIHVSDLVDAHLLALDYLAAGGRSDAFNLGSGAGYTVRQVVEAARKVTRHPIPEEIVPRRAGDPARLIASSDKARAVLKWKPRHTDLHDIISSAWQWRRAHPNGYAA